MSIKEISLIKESSMNCEVQLAVRGQNQDPALLLSDIVQVIFTQCISKSEWGSINALARVNWHYAKYATTFWGKFDLNLCPGLTILDAKAQGVTVDDEPIIDALEVFKSFKELRPHVENNEGLTLLTMVKGLTLNQLVEMAEKEGMKIEASVLNELLEELGDDPIEQTYVILITNSIFKESRDKLNFLKQPEYLAGPGCEVPQVHEYVALCILTYKFFRKCLYSSRREPHGITPHWRIDTYGISATQWQGKFLAVGDSTPDRLCIFYGAFFTGQWPFKGTFGNGWCREF